MPFVYFHGLVGAVPVDKVSPSVTGMLALTLGEHEILIPTFSILAVVPNSEPSADSTAGLLLKALGGLPLADEASEKAKDAPEAPKAKDAPEAPKAKDAPEAPKAKDAPEAPKAKDAPKASEKAKDAPKASEKAKDAPEAPKATPSAP